MEAGQAGDATMMSPAAVLDRMLDEVFVTADDWCQGSAAKDAGGDHVPFDSSLAASRCVVGGVKLAVAQQFRCVADWTAPLQYWTTVGEVMGEIMKTLGADESRAGALGIPNWNDSPHTTFEDVRLVLKQTREAVS